MSGPNADYDPVEVTPLHAREVEAMRDEAIAAIERASTLEELKEARLAFAGDRSPLALTNREIGRKLHLSEKTVKNRISRLLAKLGVQRRVQAAVLASHLEHPEASERPAR